jgi:predicted SnoaL-like aldol condensation-catalyzing enzyme
MEGSVVLTWIAPGDVMRGGQARGNAMLIGMIALAAATAAAAAPAPQCAGDTAANRQVVRDFYTLGLVERQPAQAFAKYVAADFVEHKPDVAPGTREATAAFLVGIIRDVPTARWEILRVIADGDLVALHARFTPAPGAPEYALADFFRVKDCKIAEHWDVVAGPVKGAVNPNGRF